VSSLCCIACRFQGVGTPCRLTAEGPCDRPDVCDENAQCQPRVKGPEFSCREPFTNDNCDIGDYCDGDRPQCPTTGDGAGCPIDVELKGRGVLVTCKAQRAGDVARGESLCEAEGVEAPAGALAAIDGPALAAADTPVMEAIRKPIRFAKRGAAPGRRVLKLKLNSAGRALLKTNGNLAVRIRVTLVHGRNTVRRALFDQLLRRRPAR
jgi:hypothetical protein